ncbi:MAG: hypothetical protein KDJ82_00890 [Rhodobacteraceae bacterium]|jgi:hypothetical protein|nr:hypothetical protein [Paracoccaceae bacterium]
MPKCEEQEMTNVKARGRRALKGIILFSAISIGASGAALAQGGFAELRTLPMLASSVAGKGTATFDWLAKRGKLSNAAATTPAKPKAPTRTLGKGRYVCSPAGFGRKSRCYSR